MKPVLISFDELIRWIDSRNGNLSRSQGSSETYTIYISFASRGKVKYSKQLDFEAVNNREVYVELDKDDKVIGIEIY